MVKGDWMKVDKIKWHCMKPKGITIECVSVCVCISLRASKGTANKIVEWEYSG